MLARDKRASCLKARQIGFSHTTGGSGVIWGAFHGELTTIISKGANESEEVLEKARRHASVLRRLGSRLATLTKDRANEIAFASGGRILALPSTGGRGYTGNLILDEFAYHEHAEETWDAAVPAMRLGHFRLRVISTPNGVGNTFANHIDAIRTGKLKSTRLFEVPLEVAERDGYPVNWEQCWEDAHGDPRLFEQMYRCSFLDNTFQYIPTEAIEACAAKHYDVDDLGHGEYYAGLDIGREADLSVLVVLKVVKRVAYVVHVRVMKRTEFAEQERAVDEVFARYNLRRLCIDETGMGKAPAENIKKKHSERVDVAWRRPRVEPISFTVSTKETLATGLFSAMAGVRGEADSKNRLRLRLPPTDAILIDSLPGTVAAFKKELASIQRKITSAGNVVYTTPRTEEGHGDRAWALALALHASSGSNPMVEALLGNQ